MSFTGRELEGFLEWAPTGDTSRKRDFIGEWKLFHRCTPLRNN